MKRKRIFIIIGAILCCLLIIKLGIKTNNNSHIQEDFPNELSAIYESDDYMVRSNIIEDCRKFDAMLCDTMENDFNHLYERYSIMAEGTEVFLWDTLNGERHVEFLSDTYGYTFSYNPDFENHVYILSYGHEILEVEGETHTLQYGGNNYVLTITFDAQYHENIIYVYELKEKIIIVPQSLKSPYYIVRHGKKEYIGDNVFDANIFMWDE